MSTTLSNRRQDALSRPAPTDHPVSEVVRRRWSPHAFSPRAVPREDVLSLFEAARWAPSSYNEQPWFFVIASRDDDADAYERIAATLVEPNQRWARTAPLLAITVARTSFARNGKPNRHAVHDLGLAVGSLLAEATARGLAVHQMAGFDPERAQAELGIPEGHEAIAAMAIGYPRDASALPDELRAREEAPRTRRPLSQSLFVGRWGRGVTA